MYSLRKGGGNHYAMFAGSRSDFLMLGHPEFRMGRVACEQGTYIQEHYDTTRCPSKPNRTPQRDRMIASRRQGSPRLRGPRQHSSGLTLKQRALVRAVSAPTMGMGYIEEPELEDTLDSLGKAVNDFANRASTAPTGTGGRRDLVMTATAPGRHIYRETIRPKGVGQFNYAIPESAKEMWQRFSHEPLYLKQPARAPLTSK
eukprot:TRINITY_DN96303_c0_g1_i1.p1 TRINITY_DN96303_c0_g1~~TRINITY_DN96303_c0_g1_i1.p1  ORF type:complete len:201 (-),score=28.44 TRINITY_DN96303_c0_g1_i1:59-661(-)